MTKKIYIIRHGQTEYNKLGMVQGSGIDSSLNEVGEAQAAAFYDSYKATNFDKIYTSKLKRTHQSVSQFIIDSVPWQQLYGLNEINWGNRKGKIITQQDNNEYLNMMENWNNGKLNFSIGGGESPLAVQARQVIAWKYIMSSNEENILVCMHGRALRILLCLLLKVDLKYMNSFPHENLCLHLLTYKNGKYHLKVKNDTSHLNNIKLLHKAS